MTHTEHVAILKATLRGVRGMAELEANNGSSAWRKALAFIDEALNADAISEDARVRKPTKESENA